MNRPKFSIRSMLWLILVFAASFGGRESMRRPVREEMELLKSAAKNAELEVAATLDRLVQSQIRSYDLEAELLATRELVEQQGKPPTEE